MGLCCDTHFSEQPAQVLGSQGVWVLGSMIVGVNIYHYKGALLALVAGVKGCVLTGVEIGVLSCMFLYFCGC